MASVQLGSSVFIHLLNAHCSVSDLGPISVNWFDELTAEAVQRQPKLCVDEEKRAEDQDDCVFKTPKHKQSSYSQLDSTPIIFKEHSLCSPLFISPASDLPKNQSVAENVRRVNKPEESPGNSTQLLHNEVIGTSRQCHNNSPSVMREIFKTPLWDKRCMSRTPQRDGKNDVLDSLFCTPKLIRNTTPRCISESLGAEADPEMSWSSSLATPPSPTVIIAQANEETYRIKPFDNKDAVIVRSLFTKLCNDAETSSIAAPADPNIPKALLTKADDNLADSMDVVPSEVARGTVITSESVKLQKDITKKEDTPQMTDNILEGMEDVLSIFFNSGKPTGLRKVKVDSRAKRRKKLDSNVVQESTDEQNTFPENQNKCKKSVLTNRYVLNDKSSSIPSSYEWSPLALPDLNSTEGVTHLQDETESGLLKMIYSPNGNNEKSISLHVPCEVANSLEVDFPSTLEQKLHNRTNVDITHSAQNNSSDTLETTSAVQELSGQQVMGEMNVGRPQTRNSNITVKLSVLKRQSKFLYSLHNVKNGQDGRTKDISNVLYSELEKTEKDDQYEVNAKALHSVNAACTHNGQNPELTTNEASKYVNDDSLDIQEIEENLLNLKCEGRPISEHASSLESSTGVTSICNEHGITKAVEMKAENSKARKMSLQESIGISEKDTLDDDAVDILAKSQVLESAVFSDVISHNKEELEIHKANSSTTTENPCADRLPLNTSLCKTEFENFGGFKTASNKNIHISDESLRKVELLFKEDDSSCHISHPLPATSDINIYLDVVDSSSLFSGFRTASHKEIVVTESNISKGMLLFKDIEDGENLTEEQLLHRPSANLSSREKVKEPVNQFEPLGKVILEKAKDDKQTSNILMLDKQSSIEVRPKGMGAQNILLSQHCKDNSLNEKSQMKKGLSSEIQSHVSEILTESQKAEVSELSSLLENAGSQFDFTQFRKTGIVTINNNPQNMQSADDGISESETLNNSDVWKDVDFNDSFAAGAEHIENNKSSVRLSLEREDNLVGATACVNVSEEILPKEKERKCGGFSLASGKCINITDEDMIKAFEFFNNLDDIPLLSKHSSNDVNKGPTNFSTAPAILNVQEVPKASLTVPDNVEKSSTVFKKVPIFSIEKQTSTNKLMDKFVAAGNDVGSSAEVSYVQNVPQGGFASGSCLSAMPIGFSTAKGKVITVDKAALEKAKAIFNDVLDAEDLCKNQGGASSVNVKSTSTISQGEDCNEAHGLTDKQSAGNFITSGKGAAVSPVPDQRANHTFEKVSGSTQCIPLPKQDAPIPKLVQFSTARGKLVNLSEESLNRAWNIFADIDNHQLGPVVENSKGSMCKAKISTNNFQHITSKTCQEKEPVLLPPMGFSTASGKSVAVSCDSLQKARAIFAEAELAMHDRLDDMETKKRHYEDQNNPADIKFSKQTIKDCDVTIKKNTDVTRKVTADVLLPVGFSTASGKTVAVSNESLEKARQILADNDNIDMKREFQSSQTRFEKGNPEVSRDNVLCFLENKDLDKVNVAGAHPRKPSESTTVSGVGKPYLPPIADKSRIADPTMVSVPPENAPGILMPSFSTAGGKSVQMSDEALRKAREMFTEIDDGQLDTCLFKPSAERNTKWKNVKNIKDKASITVPAKKTAFTLPAPGFSTASGKTVALSADALRKARILFTEIDDDINNENIGQRTIEINHEEQYEANETISKPHNREIQSLNSPLKQNSGICPFFEENLPKNICKIQGNGCFSTASGKAITLSEEALKKAQEKFSEMDECLLQQNEPGVIVSDCPLGVPKFHTSLQKKPTGRVSLETMDISKLSNAATTTFGFSTASGKLVSVSETAMQKVKDLFEESEHLQEHCLSNGKGDGNVNKKTHRLSPLVNNPETISQVGGLQSYRARLIENNNVNKPCNASSSNIQHPMLRHSTPSHKARELGKICVSSVTTHTPENYFEIEAAESAKAFMDDEILTDGMRSAEASNKPLNLRNGKRLRSDDRNPHGEPPIKRKLLPEFDRSSVQGSKLTLKPLTTSPISEFKDRRTFLYNVSLKASFCDPASFSVREKVAQDSQDNVQRHFYSRFAAVQQSSSDNISNAADNEGQLNKLVSYRPSTGRFASPLKVAIPMLSEEHTSDQTDLEPHNCKGALEHDKSSEPGLDISQLLANVHCARDMQEMRTRKKQRQKIKPYPGSLYQLKASSADRIPLVSAVHGKFPTVYTKSQLYRFGVLKSHIGIGSEAAKTFEFHYLYYFTKDSLLSNGGVQIADGGWLIPSDKLTAGREEFYRALCDTTGVDPKLISSEWVCNHYRWIVWKLAAMEVMFPELFASRCLTPERVLLQLKYRYDVEIDKSQRSALRKIMERDDTAAKTLVLCISKVISLGGNDKSESSDRKQGSAVIEVTDGWYGIKALLDTSLTALLHRGRLFIGQKIIVNGAELVGSEDACSPLEAPDSLMLKLAANSTRPARWYTRLGYFRDPRPFCLPLSSLFAEGGIVGCVDIVIQRIYPMQWMEKMANGIYVFRNDRAEEREAERHSSKQQKSLETLFLKIQDEFEQQEARERKARGKKRSSLSVTQISALQDGSELYEALQNEPDPGYLESCMSSEQLCALNHHRQLIHDKKQAQIQTEFRKAIESAEQGSSGCTRREVTPVWKMRIVDYKEQDPTSAYMLNIWRPLPDVVSLLKEGCRFKIYQLVASQSKCKTDTAAVQLTATKKTQFQQLQPSQDFLTQIYTERQVTEFSQLLEPKFKVEYGEVDIIGLVISTHQKTGVAPIVYLSDEAHNFIAVKFWADLCQLSLEELTKPSTFIAASNLRWRSEYTAGIPIVSAGDLSYISANPKEQHLQKAILRLRQSVQAVKKFQHEAEIKLLNVLKLSHPPEKRSLAQQSSDSHAAPSKVSTPMAKFGRVQMNAVSTPDKSSYDLDPRTCKKMKGLDFLSRIPSPPPLTPVGPLVSPSLQKAFRPPRSMHKDVHPVPMSKGEFVADEELAMINTQALVSSLEEGKTQPKPEMSADIQREKMSPNPSKEKLNPSVSSSHTDTDTTTKKVDAGFNEQGRLRTRRRHRL